MESNINKSFELSEEDNISWEEIYEKIPKLLKMIQKILETKSEVIENNINTLVFLKEFNLGITEDEPYIMQESDFENINFYKYILKVAIYYLKQDNINIIINKLNPSIFKHLIDLCIIIQRILKEEKNYEKRDVKYYIYHIINAFSDDENKLEKDFKFLKSGIELLLKAYNINDYKEYFSNKNKIEIRRNFCSCIQNLLTNIKNYMIKNNNLEDENNNIIEKIDELCGKANKLLDEKTDANFLEKAKSILTGLSNSLNNENTFTCICKYIDNFKGNIPKNLNGFYYSIFCFDYINRLEKYNEKIYAFTFFDDIRNDFSNNCICDYETKKSFLKYHYQFLKNKKLYYKLISGRNSNKKYFEKLLDDQKFRDKIINFYSSQTIMDFIKEKCDQKEQDKIIEKLPYLLDLMKKEKFWKQIMLFPMSNHKMASITMLQKIIKWQS